MRYGFTSWTDETGSVIGTAPTIALVIDRDRVLTANYVEEIRVLTITSGAGGTTDPSPDSYQYPADSIARITAYPDSGYRFDYWELDGVARTENPIDVLMDMDHTLHAVFVAAPPPEYMLTISATVGGITDPAPGSYYYPAEIVAQIIAYPDRGYLFDHWLVDGVTRETENPISVLMDRDHTLQAVFIKAPPIPTPPIIKILFGLGGLGLVGAVGLIMARGERGS